MNLPATVLLNRLLARGKFRHIQVLLRLAELGSVQRTADVIGLTQSSVTQTLAYLESLLEVRLFERHARGVSPTPVCLDLLPVARQVMLGLAEGADVLVARQQRGGSVLRLMTSAAALGSLLLDVLGDFHARHPAVQVHLREAEGEDQLLAVARGEVDLVACRQPVAVPGQWVFEPLMPDQFVVVVRPGHPLLRRSTVGWKALGREIWLLAPAETAARRQFDEVAARLDQPPRTHPLVSRSIPATLDTLQREPVLALLPLSFVRRAVAAGQLAVLPLPEPMPMNALGLLRPEPLVLPAAQALAEHLRNCLAANRP
jgi:DNA-binding transcriptional LysR family regulator